jgi:hypothetical protein
MMAFSKMPPARLPAVTRAWVKKLPSPKDDPATLAAAVKTRLAIIIILFIDGEKKRWPHAHRR